MDKLKLETKTNKILTIYRIVVCTYKLWKVVKKNCTLNPKYMKYV